MSTTVILDPQESGEPSEQLNAANPSSEQIEELQEDVATVADEILVEVKECRTQQQELIRDLAALRENGAEQSQKYQELLTELKNSREEVRNLLSELKTLQEQTQARQPSPSLTPSTSQQTPEAETVTVGPPINPESVEAANPAATTEPKKRKRYRI